MGSDPGRIEDGDDPENDDRTSMTMTRLRKRRLRKENERTARDDALADEIESILVRIELSSPVSPTIPTTTDDATKNSGEDEDDMAIAVAHFAPLLPFVERWYGNEALWGPNLQKRPDVYGRLVRKRASSLARRGRDLATILREASPPRQYSHGSQRRRHRPQPRERAPQRPSPPWPRTLFVSGSYDEKYGVLGQRLVDSHPREVRRVVLPDAGHALLLE